MNPTVLATVNQKGGVAKTTSCINIGAAMAREGKKVLLVDTDPQGSLTISMGWQQPRQSAAGSACAHNRRPDDQGHERCSDCAGRRHTASSGGN